MAPEELKDPGVYWPSAGFGLIVMPFTWVLGGHFSWRNGMVGLDFGPPQFFANWK